MVDKTLTRNRYSHESEVGNAPAYSMAGRAEKKLESIAPGPGAYNVDSTRSVPAFSFSGRHEQKTDSHSPGPGAYAASPPSRGRAFSMGSRPERKVDDFVRMCFSTCHLLV
jgi:Sperm-tail PG-rich repeat